MLITDGMGSGMKAAVNKNNQLAVVTTSAFHQAAIRGDAYAWNAVSSVIGGGDVFLTVRNLSSDRLLVINRINLWVDVPTAIDIAIQTITTAFGAAGAAVVGVNLNTSSAKVADAGAYADDDNVAIGTIICTLHTNEATADIYPIDFPTNDCIVLGTNGLISVECVANPGGYECTIFGYYIDA